MRHFERFWSAGLGRARRLPVDRPRADPEIWEQERRRREPITAEIAKIRNGFLLDFVALLFLLIPSLLALRSFEERSNGANQDFLAWLVAERTTWDSSMLLGLPVSVLVPGVLTVILVGGSKSPNGDLWSARELAYLEVTRAVLGWGLIAGAFLALLAVIPQSPNTDHIKQLVGLLIAVACLIFRQLLSVTGTQKDLLAIMALARKEAAGRSKNNLARELNIRWPFAQRLTRPGLRTTAPMVALGTLMLSIPGFFAILLSMYFAGWGDFAKQWVTAGLISVFAATQSLFVLVALSRKRLSIGKSDYLGAVGFAAVPALMVALSLSAATSAWVTSAPSAPLLSITAGSVLLADMIVIGLNRTILASVVDFRRLGALENYASSQIRWLAGQ